MLTQRVTCQGSLVFTANDVHRLQRLLESPRYRTTHGAFVTHLKEELQRGEVVEAEHVPGAIVTMHSRVRVRDLKQRESETYVLVYPPDADIDAGKLSVLAPLGTALLGARLGQVVIVEAPAGRRRLKIEKILYQPEAAGDLHL